MVSSVDAASPTEPTSRLNAIMLVIDNLRFDTFEDRAEAAGLFPNLAGLVERGWVRPLISNGHATKFAMAPIFSMTYPLDQGGYNFVLRDRPRSFAEQLKDAGYVTFMFQGDDNDGPVSCCDRGFDHVEAVYDFRVILQNFILEVLRKECLDWQRGRHNDQQIATFLRNSFGALMDYLADGGNRVPRAGLPAAIRAPSQKLRRAFREERRLLDREPTAVAWKILTLEPHFYHLCLGKPEASGLALGLNRLLYRVGGGIRSRLLSRKLQPFRVLAGQTVPVASELLAGAHDAIRHAARPWFIFAHVMDLHDRRFVHRPFDLLRRFLWLGHWMRHKRGRKSVERFLYDSALAKVDREIGRLRSSLEATGQEQSTMFLISADHGCEMYDAIRRGHHEEFGWRAHPEHIEVPLICAPTDRQPADTGLLDSMSFPATLLDLLGVAGHPSFLGRSALNGGRSAVISENAGRGNASVDEDDLYFTVTTETSKLMAVLIGDELQVHRLYDRVADPLELQNIVDRPDAQSRIEALVKHLFEERGELLAARGAKHPFAVPETDGSAGCRPRRPASHH